MTKKQKEVAKRVFAELSRLTKSTDIEEAHAKADDALCELLKELGFDEIVEIYHRVPKWYA